MPFSRKDSERAALAAATKLRGALARLHLARRSDRTLSNLLEAERLARLAVHEIRLLSEREGNI